MLGFWFIPIFKTLECPSYLGWKGRWTPGLPVTRCLWDSVPQTSIYSNSNSAVVEPPGGGCNILPRSQVPILGLYYATISTIATSSGSGTCGAAQNANRWRQQRPLFHFLFRSRGLGKREIPFPFPVHVAQESGKYHFRFRCMWLREPGNTISVSGARGIQVAGVSQGTETLAKG